MDIIKLGELVFYISLIILMLAGSKYYIHDLRGNLAKYKPIIFLGIIIINILIFIQLDQNIVAPLIIIASTAKQKLILGLSTVSIVANLALIAFMEADNLYSTLDKELDTYKWSKLLIFELNIIITIIVGYLTYV